MSHALNTTHIKKTNQRLVLDAIFHSVTTSRTQLAKELSLSKPAISDNLAGLLREGIVEEIGESSVGPAGGRKSILLQFNPNHKYIISIDLNFSNPVFALGNLNGDILNSFDISISAGTPIESCMELVNNSIRILLQSLGNQADKVYCIALAAPGVFDENGNPISYNTGCDCPAWWELNLKQELARAFDIPIIIFNDVKAATLGEWTKGAGNNEQDLLYISAGLGIGAGIILGGSPFIGKYFNSGEIFDHIDASNGTHLEDTVCIGYLKSRCAELPASSFPGEESMSLDAIIRAYQANDPGVTEIVDDICRRLAIITYNYMNFISVRHVIFGGEYAAFGTRFADHLTRLFVTASRPMPSITITQLGKLAGIQGMFCIARQKYFDEICSQ